MSSKQLERSPGIVPRRSRLLLDVKYIPTITPGPPVLDAETFERLLAAAHILQECNDHGQKSKVGSAGLPETIAQNAEPVQVVPLTAQAARVPVPNSQREQVIVQADFESFAPQNHFLISPDTAHQFSVLSARLEALTQQKTRSNSRGTRLPVSVATEVLVEEHRGATDQAVVQKKARFAQPKSGSTQLIPLGEIPSGTSNLPHRITRKRTPENKQFFWTVFAVAAILFLTLGASVHRLSPSPSGLALSSQGAQQQKPLHRTTEKESLAMKPAGLFVLSNPPPRVEKSDSPEKRVVKSNSLYSIVGSETHFVAEENARVASEIENMIRADSRLHMRQVQVRASNGIVTLSGDVGSDAERMAAAQDAAHSESVEALVNNLRVITYPQSLTGAVQKPSPSVAPILRGSAAESSTAESIIKTTSRGSVASSNTHPTDSKIVGVSSSSSPVSTSAIKTPLSEPGQITVPNDTVLAVRLTETLSSDLNQPGDTFLASLASPIVIGDRVIVPEGAGVKGKIVDVWNARRFSGRSGLVIEVTGLAYNGRTYVLRSSQYSKQGESRNAYSAAAITGGTGVGAIIGTIVGRGKGAAIGAAIGAAAGTGVQSRDQTSAGRAACRVDAEPSTRNPTQGHIFVHSATSSKRRSRFLEGAFLIR
jgi:BON domain-containing protein